MLARCEEAIQSWLCQRDDKISLIVSAEAFVRIALSAFFFTLGVHDTQPVYR